jgi:DEAD/DEAH box helicase domain-containing protein
MPFDPVAFLEELQDSRFYRGQIAHIETLPPREAQFGELSTRLPAPLQVALGSMGIQKLYSHQAQAVEAARGGKSFVVVTATASGKTLCYNLPILERRLNEVGAKALYLYPTKALAQDQLRGLLRLQEAGDMHFKCGTYDGDTPSSTRSALRDRADLILTNPDMLHAGILPSHAKWAHFWEKLRFVVIDEVHTYRGIFGSNVANVLRRLQRVCKHYGSAPQFLCASATIANPAELASQLCGQSVELIDNDGAPRGAKYFVLWNPPPLKDEGGRMKDENNSKFKNQNSKPEASSEYSHRAGAESSSFIPQPSSFVGRRSPNSEAVHLLCDLVKRGVATIAFTRARVVTELILRYAQDELAQRSPRLLESIRAYRAGYLASERREIEQQLFSGELLGVIATSALELGIDVGALDACLLVGYPGSIASTWQRAGRAGRGHSPSLTILIASENPIDQYLMNHGEYIFGRSSEQAVIDPDNAYILAKHLRCAAAELPFSLSEARSLSTYAPALLQLLEEEGQLRRAGDAWYWAKAGTPARDVSLRNIGANTVAIHDVSRNQIIGTVDETTAFQTVHTGAVYLHEAETYFIEKLDLTQHIAHARRGELDYFTQAVSEAQIHIEETDEEKRWRVSQIGFGSVTVTLQFPLFKKVKFGSLDNIGFGPLDLPPQTLDTVAWWIAPPDDALRKLREWGRVPYEGMLGIANAAIGVLPLRVLCDSSDIGAVVDSSQLGVPALFLFDKYPGGLGFAQRGFDLVEEILTAAHQTIAECPCEDGCPSCVGSASKTYTYYDAGGEARERIPDKEAALVVLHEMLQLEPYIPKNAPDVSTHNAAPIEQLPPQVENRVRKQLQRLKNL